jgi:phenylacetate-CoA ligase
MRNGNENALDAYRHFVETDLNDLLSAGEQGDGSAAALALFHRVAVDVPAYGTFLADHGIDPDDIRTPAQFAALPLVTKANYVQKYPLSDICRGGRLTSCDMIAVSSGSTGTPTPWPRSVADEIAVATRFEQIFADSFRAQ